MNHFDKQTEEAKQRALAIVLRQNGVFTHCVDYYHSCHDNCKFHDPYRNGSYLVCVESLRVHACKQTTQGTNACLPTNDGFNVVCKISGREIKNQKVIDVERNTQRLMYPNPHCKINVALTQKQRNRATQTKRLWVALGDVIHRIFNRRSRQTYNRLPSNVIRHYAEITKRLWNVDGPRSFNIGTEVVKIVANSKFNLHLGHVRVSRLIALEKRCKYILERAMNTIVTPKKVDFIYNHPHESCVYVIRCTLDGFRKDDFVLFDSDQFADLAPMPTDKGLDCVFGIITKEITNCSLILQETFNKFTKS